MDTQNNQSNEIETKFLVSSFDQIEASLIKMGAQKIQDQHLEINYRFDTTNQKLTRTHQVLRLRKDSKIWLTYKGPSDYSGGVSSRREIEIEISSLEAAQELLNALEFELSVKYEKFRSVFLFNGTHVTLDKMPYGLFVEIESENQTKIEIMASHLNLNWECRIAESYLTLFYRLKRFDNLTFRDLTFSNFETIGFDIKSLGFQFADL